MQIARVLVAAVAYLFAGPAAGVDFGVMETATTVEVRQLKFVGYPMAIRARPHLEQDMGVTVGAGYGVSPDVDVELQFATFDDLSLLGADAEYLVARGEHFSASIGGGLHRGDSDFGTVLGYDATLIVSYRVPGSALSVNAALDYADEDLDFTPARQALIGARHQTVHVVPGLSYRVSRDVDVMGELGLHASDDARDYVALGLSTYFR